ncbi:hypothetical protein, partial [Ligilactobacillus animalis]
PKPNWWLIHLHARFRAMLFCMTPKRIKQFNDISDCFRAMLFCMTPKQAKRLAKSVNSFFA